MKKTLCLALICAMLISAFTFAGASAAAEGTETRELGTMYVSKLNGIWANPTTNCMILITPGQSVSGLYYHRLYAVYDEEKEGYVVEKKVWSHWNYSEESNVKTVTGNSIGICFNYSPLTAAGAKEALYNWKTWCRIREGDVLKLEGIDVKKRTIDTTGTWGTDSFVSNAKITVSTTRKPFSGTDYSDVRIVALGDSITSNGGWTEIVGDKLGTDIINAGVGGDRTDEAINRFDRDVTPYDPDVVLIMFGINDILQWQRYSPTLRDKYENNLKTLYAKCAALGAKVVFMTPNKINYTSYEVRFEEYGGMDACFKTYRETMQRIAEENGCLFVDIFTPWENLGDVTQYLIDTCHPTGAGYMIFADTIYDCLKNNAGYLVSKDIFTLKEAAAEKCVIKDGKYLVGTTPGMTDDEIKALFDKDVEIIETESSRRVIRYTDADNNSAVCVEAVKGDADGNGKIDSTDYLTVKRALLNVVQVYGAQKESCDANSDGKLDATDYLSIKRHLLNISSLYQ